MTVTANAIPADRFATREEWMQAAVPILADLIEAAGGPTFKRPLVSVGFPSTGARGRRIGECWTLKADNGVSHIFIHPSLDQAVRVLDVLLHELVHASVGPQCKHGGRFRSVAIGVGLGGKMTATVAGPALREKLEALARELGAFPHRGLSAAIMDRKKQTTRMKKYSCPGCGQIIRAAREDLNCQCGECSTRSTPVLFELA